MGRPVNVLISGMVSLMVVIGCGDDEAGSSSPCNVQAEKLRSCGLLSEGVVRCAPADSFDACAARCFTAASCAEVEAATCGFGSGPGTLFACYEDCWTFTCRNGMQISNTSRCDGYADCSDDSDEEGCPMFRCADGRSVVQSWRCDGQDDCNDGSDELGCPAFNCTNGAKVAVEAKCDGYPDCSDASDEAGCSMYRCESGESVIASSKCDGWSDCGDGSDEVGCPELAHLTCPP